MEDEFRMVTRKKWRTRKNAIRHRTQSSEIYGKSPVNVDKFLKRLDQICKEMLKSEYFQQSTTSLSQSVAKLCRSHTNALQLQRLVCFGIGPFTRSYHAMHQLAFILCVQRHYDITEALYFDPVLDESEKEALQLLQCTVMVKNCEAKYEANVPTLFYMPHCPNALTNNLLWRNWQPSLLNNTVLINNSFNSLITNKPERLLRLDSQFIIDVLPHTTESPLEDEYETRNVFNDLSIHIFPLNNLPPEDSEFWAERPAPIYKGQEATEIITAADSPSHESELNS